MEERIIKIYKITNLKNNRVYVGQTYKTLKERLGEHFKPSQNKKSYNKDFYGDIKKFGKDNFTIELLDTCFHRHRFIIEKYWIETLAENNIFLYNIMIGSKHSEITKKKFGKVNRNYCKNKKFKEKMSSVTSGSKNGMYGRKDENAVNGQKVFMYDKNGHLLKEFPSIKEALKFLNLKGHTKLIEACRENILYKGFYWEKLWSNSYSQKHSEKSATTIPF